MYNGRFGGANIIETIPSANRQERMHIKVRVQRSGIDTIKYHT